MCVSVCVGQKKNHFLENNQRRCPLTLRMACNDRRRQKNSIRIINVRASTNQWIRLICNDLFDTWNWITHDWINQTNSFHSICECQHSYHLQFLSHILNIQCSYSRYYLVHAYLHCSYMKEYTVSIQNMIKHVSVSFAK